MNLALLKVRASRHILGSCVYGLASDYNSIKSEDIKHVLYFQRILEYLFSLVTCLLDTMCMSLCEFVVLVVNLL